MKIKILISYLLLGAAINSWTEDLRAFTDIKGRTINARIIDYKASSKKVKIEREDKRVVSIPLKFLSKRDQDFIQYWAAKRAFFNPEIVRVSCSREEIRPEKIELSENHITVENAASYKIDIQCRQPFDNLRIDYRVVISRTMLPLESTAHNQVSESDIEKINQCINEDTSRQRIHTNTLEHVVSFQHYGRYSIETEPIIALASRTSVRFHQDRGNGNTVSGTLSYKYRIEQIEGLIVRLQWLATDNPPLERFIFYPPEMEEKNKWQDGISAEPGA